MNAIFVTDTDFILKGNCVLTQYLLEMLPSPDLAMVEISRSLLRSPTYMGDLYLVPFLSNISEFNGKYAAHR